VGEKEPPQVGEKKFNLTNIVVANLVSFMFGIGTTNITTVFPIITKNLFD